MFSERSLQVSWVVLVSVTAIMFCSCTSVTQGQSAATDSTGKATIEVKPFGEVDGQPVQLYTLTNAKGMKVQITNYGAIVTSLTAPDKNGKMGDIVMGYDNLQDYVKNSPYFGAIVGRYGNRIGKGKFTIDGKEYSVTVNDGVNSLHGGKKGFDKVVWQSEKVEKPDGVGVKLTYVSKDGEEGYPGNLKATVTYLLTNNDELRIDYEATTDKPTPVNLTHHGYWNLNGFQRDILGEELMINADKYTPVDSGLIPTGKLASVEGTPFDFRKLTPIGARINDDNEQLKFGKGYDHNWVLNKKDEEMSVAAELYDPMTGRVMTVLTTEPGIQFYSGNFLDGTITGKGGVVYKHRYALCLETQHYPDSPNKPNFPSTILRPGEDYRTQTVYKFSVR
jgi:aldose 1-epimerase